MPVADPNAGRRFVWLISGFLLASVAIGGGFLVAYLTLPVSSETNMFMYIGMTLICIPWCFWILTCMYRCMASMTGMRIVCGDIDVSAHPSSRKFGGSTAGGLSRTENESSRRDGNNVGGSSREKNAIEQEGNGRRSSANDVSVATRESEMPLAKSMAS